MELQNYFYIGGKKVCITLNSRGLALDYEGAAEACRLFTLREIVGCWPCPKGRVSCSQTTPRRSSNPPNGRPDCPHASGEKWKGLSVEVCERSSPAASRKWASRVLVLRHLSADVLASWHSGLWDWLEGLRDRPRRLLVIVNPVGGSRKGPKIYEKKIAPLFRRAGIGTTVLQTLYKGHGTPLIQKVSSEGLLQECDGVVAVGGDGIVSEIVTGLFLVETREKGLDPHSPGVDLPPTALRVGIVPCGSTDAICYATHGNNDVVTAALHIIMGDRKCIDVAALHSQGELLRIVSSFISYGYFGDLLRSSEQWRWLGPPRYFVSGLRQLFRSRSHSVKIRVKVGGQADGSDLGCQGEGSRGVAKSSTCSSICSTCSHFAEGAEVGSGEDWVWKQVSGKYSIVSAALISCACKMSPRGVSPTAHLGDGNTDLILVSGSCRKNLLSYLFHTRYTGNASTLDHVDMIRTNEVHFSASPAKSSFNCDGEELEATSVGIRVHRQKLQLFCRGLEDISLPLEGKS